LSAFAFGTTVVAVVPAGPGRLSGFELGCTVCGPVDVGVTVCGGAVFAGGFVCGFTAAPGPGRGGSALFGVIVRTVGAPIPRTAGAFAVADVEGGAAVAVVVAVVVAPGAMVVAVVATARVFDAVVDVVVAGVGAPGFMVAVVAATGALGAAAPVFAARFADEGATVTALPCAPS
jgi:hypothetical protein